MAELPAEDGAVPPAALRADGPGRRRITSRAELEQVAFDLFGRQGFERTTVQDIARAAGIGRRTFFRYFASKNDVPWGDFDAELVRMRRRLEAVPARVPLMDAIARAVVDFNRVAPEQVPAHRRRMELILTVPALQAHSTLRYAAWRQVIADFAAARTGLPRGSLIPRAIGYAVLGVAVAAYEQWLAGDEDDLCDLLDAAVRALGAAFAGPAASDAPCSAANDPPGTVPVPRGPCRPPGRAGLTGR